MQKKKKNLHPTAADFQLKKKEEGSLTWVSQPHLAGSRQALPLGLADRGSRSLTLPLL
jgi:hypothetical protein